MLKSNTIRRWLTISLVAILMLVTQPIFSEPGVVEEIPEIVVDDGRLNTPEKVDAWLKTLSEERLINIVIAWDRIWAAVPIVMLPDLVFVLEKGGTLHAYPKDGTPGTINIAGELRYIFKIPEIKVEDFYHSPSLPLWPYIVIGAVGIAAGVTLVLVLK